MVTLGQIRGAGDRVEVALRTWCGNVCMGQQTWIVERRDHGGWVVVGNTGYDLVS